MVRSLALVTDAFGGKGGIAQYNRDFLRALIRGGGIASVVILPRHGEGHWDLPTGMTQLPERRGRLRYGLAALWSAWKGGADVIFCGHLHIAALAALIARLTGAKLIVQMHGIEAWQRPSLLRRLAVESADRVLCVSRYTRAAVLGWADIAPEKVVVLPNTVDESFTPGDGSAMRSELGLSGKQVMLTVGRMDSRERYKGHDRIIAAMPQLLAEGHDAVYVIVGEGSDRSRLEQMAHTAGLAERVKFLGMLDRDRLMDAYRMADLFVMPSTGEGFGIAFLEAMACGTPALGLDVAGASDALADGALGTAVPETDFIAALSRQLGCSKGDSVTLARSVRSRFGRDAFDAGVGAVVQSLLQEAA